MPGTLPTASDVHVNAPLTNISIAFMQEAKDFVAGQVFPVVPVQKQSDRYYVYDRSYWFRNGMKKRAPGTESAGGGWAVDNTPSYFADVWAEHKDVDDQVRANQDPVINMDRDASEFLAQQALLNMEIQWAARYFTTGIWTGSTTGTDITPGTLWDATGGDPVTDIDNQNAAMKEKTGKKGNKMVFGHRAWVEGIKNNPIVLDRIKYTEKGMVTTDLVASLLDLDQVLVAGGTQNTALEGATAAYDFILGDNDALLLYAEPRPSILKPSAGYHFAWTGFLGAGPMGQRIKRFRMEHLSADRVEMEQAFDCKLVAADLGVFFSNAIT